MGMVEKAHIIFLTTTGGSRGQGIGHRGQLPPHTATPLEPAMAQTQLDVINIYTHVA